MTPVPPPSVEQLAEWKQLAEWIGLEPRAPTAELSRAISVLVSEVERLRALLAKQT